MVQVNVLAWPQSQKHSFTLQSLLLPLISCCLTCSNCTQLIAQSSRGGQPCHEKSCSYTRQLTLPSGCSALKQSKNKGEHSARPFIHSCDTGVFFSRNGVSGQGQSRSFRTAHLNSNTITIVVWCKSGVMFKCLQPCYPVYFCRTWN